MSNADVQRALRGLVSLEEAAAIAGVSASTVRGWTRTGRLPLIHLGRRAVRVSREALEAFLAAERSPAVAG